MGSYFSTPNEDPPSYTQSIPHPSHFLSYGGSHFSYYAPFHLRRCSCMFCEGSGIRAIGHNNPTTEPSTALQPSPARTRSIRLICGCIKQKETSILMKASEGQKRTFTRDESMKVEAVLEDFLRQEPTEEEIATHKAIKNCLSEMQKSAIDKLEEILKEKGGKLLLVEDPELSDLKNLITFMLSDYANEGSERMTLLKKGAIPLLRLHRNDFDSRGDFEFPSDDGIILKRGGMDYHQPDKTWVRVGLRCIDMYDNGNDDWLKMDSNPNEWAVGFHGSTREGNQGISETRTFFTNSGGQAHCGDKDVNEASNRKGQPCGAGAYFANKIDISANFYARDVEGQKCVFQVRLKPSEVRIPEGRQDYMIVNDAQYARPYGICLKNTVTNRRK